MSPCGEEGAWQGGAVALCGEEQPLGASHVALGGGGCNVDRSLPMLSGHEKSLKVFLQKNQKEFCWH